MSSVLAVRTFGAFEEETVPSAESLTLVFAPSALPMRDRWRTHRLSAVFLADYFSTFFTSAEKPGGITDPRSELVSSITFIANELLENAMKFSLPQPQQPVVLTVQLCPQRLVFLTQNCAHPAVVEQLQRYIETLLQSDPMTLYIQTMEHNAATVSDGSGLGILTILNDYTSRVGWRFEPLPEGQVLVTTQVQLAVYE
ncbi:MAG: DUF6272 family protein [Cyanobacteria bacterium J069]|nr:MAG: ATP-binding protein [Cyanobacteria bacterium J069]